MNQPSRGDTPFITIIMPALNEARHIAAAIGSLVPPADDEHCEIIVVDGCSTDETAQIVQRLGAHDKRIRLIDNPQRIQSAGVNRAARCADARARYLVRADCHALYPPGFARRVAETLMRTGAASVVVPMLSRGNAAVQRGIAAAQNSRLGNGGAAHRGAGVSGFVDHGHHAGFDARVFRALGGYDEGFSHNEDAEYDRRVVLSGGRIYLDQTLRIIYWPRADLASLARQYWNFGKGRARTLRKHAMAPKPRQLAPVGVLAALSGAVILAPVFPAALVIPALYAGACLGWGGLLALRERDPGVAFSGPAAMIMHLAWACGFVTGWLTQRNVKARPALANAAHPLATEPAHGNHQ
jgi:succinoglycan biosynthesis protein ExoA